MITTILGRCHVPFHGLRSFVVWSIWSGFLVWFSVGIALSSDDIVFGFDIFGTGTLPPATKYRRHTQRWNLGAVVSCRQAGGVMLRACPFCTHHATSWGHFCPDSAYRKNPEQHLFIYLFLCYGVLLAFLFQLILLIQSACISTLSPFSTRLTPFASLGRSVLHSSRTFASSRSRSPL